MLFLTTYRYRFYHSSGNTLYITNKIINTLNIKAYQTSVQGVKVSTRDKKYNDQSMKTDKNTIKNII